MLYIEQNYYSKDIFYIYLMNNINTAVLVINGNKNKDSASSGF